MAKLVYLPNGRCDLKFGVKPKKFNRIEQVNIGKERYLFFIDKNDSVYDVKISKVLTWKVIEKGHRKINVPDSIEETRDLELFNRIKGNPFKVALNYINNRFA